LRSWIPTVLIVLACLLWLGPAFADAQSITIRGETKVFDADTLEIGPILIRLHGVDAPERGQKCATHAGGEWSCGAIAANRLADIIKGQAISCEALDRDPYGRIIAKCAAGGLDIGATLVEEGLAWAFIEFSQEYVDLENKARAKRVGVWEAPSQTPWDYRDDKWTRAVEDSPDGKCPIKGNISPGKDKRQIYHTPWSPNYSQVKIDEANGERWFCDEAEALNAGWRGVAGR